MVTTHAPRDRPASAGRFAYASPALLRPRTDRHTLAPGKFYRPDIDGLRAIAVLAVVAYHAFPTRLPGGFAGVDIFFVISGYLITGLLLREAGDGTVDIRAFYARRVRRIFPALVTVLVVAFAAGWMWLLSVEFVPFSQSVAAAAGFVANVQFWREIGYFDPAAELKPLLHLWSLAVEEQFYLVWPWLVAATATRHRSPMRVASALFVVSLVLNVALVARFGSATFLLPHTRLWELMAGALLAIHAQRRPWLMPSWVGVAGLVLLAIGFFVLSRDKHYPGVWALIPVVGTSMIIVAAPTGRSTRALSSRALVFVGLISYPLYLWHWPILAFMRIVESPAASATSLATALLLSFVLAIATFLGIERPLRSRRGRIGIIALTGAMAIVGLAGLLGASQWLKPRLYGQGLDAFSEAATDWQYPSPGFIRRRTADGIDVWTAGSGPRQVLIWGDSNAEQYGPRVQRLLDDGSLAASQTQVVFATRGSCPPIPRARIEEDEGCNVFAEKALALANTADISTVVLIAQWTGYLGAPTLRVQLPAGGELRGSAATPAALARLADVIRALRASRKRVVLVLNIPVAPELGPRSVLERRWGGSVAVHGDGISRQMWNAIRDRLSGDLVSVARQAGATLVDPADFLCDSLRCPALERNGVPRYHDGYHLRASFVRDHTGYLDSVILGAPR